MRTLFFDIDGTLLVTKNAGSIALAQAIEEEFAVPEPAVHEINFAGRTDRDLSHAILTATSVPPTPENQGRLRRRYSVILREVLGSTSGSVLPGVTDLLGALTSIPGISLAVMTGNFPETARMKLEAYQLLDFFPWVIGGDLDAIRCDMARRASAQLTRRHGPSAADDMIVIGDTPSDVRCAHTIGAKCLAVCTGSSSRSELLACGADRVVDDLCDSEAFEYLAGSIVKNA